jgi:hypothetical protein
VRTFELRVYKLRTKEALESNRTVVCPRHLKSVPRFGIEAHGFWTALAALEPRLFVLVSSAAAEVPGELSRRYLQSAEVADGTRDFDVANIIGVESTILTPSTSSLLS